MGKIGTVYVNGHNLGLAIQRPDGAIESGPHVERLIQLGRVGDPNLGVATGDDIDALLAAGSPVAIGVSGGKDSCALAFATIEHLDRIGHAGPRILVHSDLGRVEWRQSLPICELLATRLGVPLLVVRREAGDMMDRWLVRWKNNLARYVSLRCVKLILPWSTPSMRFCTSELKTAVICRALCARFPGQTIISASGIRRQESSKRAKAEISQPQAKLTSKTHRTHGVDWHPIIEWKHADVFAALAHRGFELHEAYTKFGMGRVSCAFCIMADKADLTASASCPDNAAVYREMVDLEISSTFAFQGARWLGDVAPDLLSPGQFHALQRAKEAADEREEAEAVIPDHLLYVKGWPTCMPTREEAELLASVRRRVGNVIGFVVQCTTADEVITRYAELMAENAAKPARSVRS